MEHIIFIFVVEVCGHEYKWFLKQCITCVKLSRHNCEKTNGGIPWQKLTRYLILQPSYSNLKWTTFILRKFFTLSRNLKGWRASPLIYTLDQYQRFFSETLHEKSLAPKVVLWKLVVANNIYLKYQLRYNVKESFKPFKNLFRRQFCLFCRLGKSCS